MTSQRTFTFQPQSLYESFLKTALVGRRPNAGLAAKPMLVVATKMDAAQDPARVDALRKLASERGLGFHAISSVTGEGIEGLKQAMGEAVIRVENRG